MRSETLHRQPLGEGLGGGTRAQGGAADRPTIRVTECRSAAVLDLQVHAAFSWRLLGNPGTAGLGEGAMPTRGPRTGSVDAQGVGAPREGRVWQQESASPRPRIVRSEACLARGVAHEHYLSLVALTSFEGRACERVFGA